MTRKIERHQENLASKNKQQELSSTASGITITNTDDGWQEVIGKQKKITIPHEQYSRIIGRSGSNLNVLREVTGASIEVENKRAIGDKTILIKYIYIIFFYYKKIDLFNRGNGDSIKHAYQLIMALLKNSESELMNLLPSSNENKTKSRSTTITSINENNNHDDDNTTKIQRANSTNYGPRLQNTGKSSFF
jgi:predicted PilT family ATPase